MFHFKAAFSLILKLEGGLSDDPRDPGGLTKFGISFRAHPNLDIRNLTKEDASKIYYNDYWLAASCGKLPPDLAICVFDCAVNQGVIVAKKLLQASLKVEMDGELGVETFKALSSKYRLPNNYLISEFMSRRQMRYSKTNGFSFFGKGWSSRLLKVYSVALQTKHLDLLINGKN